MACVQLMIDFQVELVTIGVFFRSELIADQRVALSNPPEIRNVQAVRCRRGSRRRAGSSLLQLNALRAPVVVRQRHAGQHALDKAGTVESCSKWIFAENADGLDVTCC